MGDSASQAISIRPATPDDAEQIACYNEAMAEQTEGVRLDPDTIRAGVRAVLDDPAKGQYYLAEADGEVVGQLMTTYEWSDWRNATFLWIQSVYVPAQHRRRGVYSRLYQYLLDEVVPAGCCGIRLYVENDNLIARQTYEKLGMITPHYTMMETPDDLRRE